MTRPKRAGWLAPHGVMHDGYGLGFQFPHSPPVAGGLLRNKTIVQVCWNAEDREVQFVNAAGLVVPCDPLPQLPELLAGRGKVEIYGGLVGVGLFARKPAAVNAMQSAGTLRKWVVYRFALPDRAFFHDQQQAWADYLKQQTAESEIHEGRQQAESWAAELRAAHLLALKQDAELAAWLRGEWPTPPLFQVAAA